MHGATMSITRNGLTIKQQAVADLVAQGWTTKEIANKLGIGPRTVEGHRDAIYDKLRVRNAVELTRKLLGAE
jgi:two-component system response regulator DctR